MLVLTRKINEIIKISDDIKITILGLNGNQVRIGIEAPDNVSIHREEIYHRIQSNLREEKKEAEKQEQEEVSKGKNEGEVK